MSAVLGFLDCARPRGGDWAPAAPDTWVRSGARGQVGLARGPAARILFLFGLTVDLALPHAPRPSARSRTRKKLEQVSAVKWVIHPQTQVFETPRCKLSGPGKDLWSCTS